VANHKAYKKHSLNDSETIGNQN